MTEQQFLAGIWQKADRLEYEEREIKKAKQRNRNLFKRSLVLGIATLFFIGVIATVIFYAGINLSAITVVVLLVVFFMETRSYSNKGMVNDGQH